MPAYNNPSTTICPLYCTCASCISQGNQEDPSTLLFGVSLHQQHSLIEDSLSQNFELSSSSSASCSPSVVANSLHAEESTSNGVIFHSPKYIFDCPPRNGATFVDSTSTPPAFQLSDELKEYGETYLRGRFEIPPGVEVGLHVLPSLPTRKTPSIMALICLAIWQSQEKRLALQDIFEAVLQQFPSLGVGNCAWKRSIRHKLSLKAAFIKMRRPRGQASTKGCLWTFDASLGDTDSPTRASRMRPKGQKGHSVGKGVRNSSPSSASDISLDISNAHESTALQLTDIPFPQQWSTAIQYPSTQTYPPTIECFYVNVPSAPQQNESYMSYMQAPSNSSMTYAPYHETAYSTYASTVPLYAQEQYELRRPTRSHTRQSQADGSFASDSLSRHHSGSLRYAPYEHSATELYSRSSPNHLIGHPQ